MIAILKLKISLMQYRAQNTNNNEKNNEIQSFPFLNKYTEY